MLLSIQLVQDTAKMLTEGHINIVTSTVEDPVLRGIETCLSEYEKFLFIYKRKNVNRAIINPYYVIYISIDIDF